MYSAPLLRVVVVFIGGILLADHLTDDISPIVWLLAISVSLLTAGASRRWPMVSSGCLMVGVMMFGAWLMSLSHEKQSLRLPQGPVCYDAVVTSEPVIHGKVVMCDLQVITSPMTGRRLKASILRDTITGRYERLHVGSGLRVCARLELPENSNMGHFNYRRWLTTHGFVARTFIVPSAWKLQSFSLHSLSATDRLRLSALLLRQKVLRWLEEQRLDDKAYSLVAAMTMGDRSLLPKDLQAVFRTSGVSHVLALSGLHLGIVYFFLTFCFRHYRRHLFQQTVLLTIVWGYVFMTGLPVSVVRAATLLTIYAVVDLMQRSRSPLNTLSLAALLMLISNPLLLWDVSFQLSMVSVLGILIFFKPLYFLFGHEWMNRHYMFEVVWSMTVVSLSAQIAVAPLVAYYFGMFSTWFLVANYVAVPSATAIIFLTFLLLLTMPLPFVRPVIVSTLDVISRLLIETLDTISSWPLATIYPIHINVIQTVLCYLLIAVLSALVVKVFKL